MISKKMIISLYSVFFVVIVLISMVFAFSVNKIDTEFSFVGEEENKAEILNDKLSAFFGKNLVFLDTDDIVSAINEDPHYECVSAVKSFPDSVKVVVKERRDVYLINFGDEQFIADENGFVFKKYSGEKTRDLITLTFENFDIKQPVVGSYISSDFDGSVKNAFEIAKSVDLTDKTSEMRVVKNYKGEMTSFVVEFSTYTNVVIKIKESDDDGVEKAKAAFKAYDAAEDYKKSFYSIESYKEGNGEICIVWTRYGD